MTRQPDIKSKSDRAVYSPSSMEGKQKVRDLKALCIQDGVTANDLLDEALNLLFKVHHWPPGNPQLTLTNYQVKPSKVLSKCEFSGCKGEAVASGVFLPKNKEYRLCKRHLVEAKNSRKVWELKN
jgi:hypothetical protein